MKALILASALSLGVASVQSATAIDFGLPDIVQVETSVTFPAGSSYVNVNALVVPASKKLVIQSVSFYKNGGPTGASIAQVSIGTTFSGQQSFWTLPAVPDDGTPYPGATLSATFFAGAGSPVVINASRTGDPSNPEFMEVVISGFYVENR